jgi:putative drug exporter of the RND superfamily
MSSSRSRRVAGPLSDSGAVAPPDIPVTGGGRSGGGGDEPPDPALVAIERTVLGRLAGFAYDRRRLVLGAWIAFLVAINIVAGIVTGVFEDKFGGGNSESQRALRLLEERFPTQSGDPGQVVFHTDGDINSDANKAAMAEVVAALRTMPHVQSILSPVEQGGQGLISRNGRTAYAIMQFDEPADDLTKSEVKPIIDRAEEFRRPGFDVELGGGTIAKGETAELGTSEIIGIFAAIIILLVAFGSVIAMGLPILTALFGIAVAAAVIVLLSRFTVVPTFGTQLAAMVGLGVGIDYALFIVTRYRQGLADGFEPRESVVLALATSGRAVLFAGCTVVISLLGMLLLGLPFVYGLAGGAIAAVLLMMLASVTLLPALLGFSGRAIDKLHLPQRAHKAQRPVKASVWVRWSKVVQRYPLIAAVISLAILVFLSLPLFGMRLAFTDAGNNQEQLTTRKAYDLLVEGFGPGTNGPLVAAVNYPNGSRIPVARLGNELRKDTGVFFVAPPTFNDTNDTAVIVFIPTTSPQDEETQKLVSRIRDDVVPNAVRGTGAEVLIGGITAGAVDSSEQLSSRLPLVIGGVVVLSFLLLMAVFRSIAVPLKAAIMNLLSIGAAYGVIVAVFQWGWLGDLIGIGKTGPIDPWVPLMLFTILFGLSMDYEVFLLSKIREEWLATGDNANAVADGLAATARVITAAAAIMVCVFGSFVLGEVRVLKLFGLGLAVAVFVDATLVRMVLVPATMELLGKGNWWFPPWLEKLVPKLSVEVAMPAAKQKPVTPSTTA